MMKRLLFVMLAFITFTVHAQKIVGYLPSYRDPSTSNIQYSKVNTIVYAFINPNANGTLITTTGLGSAWDFSMTNFLTVKSNCSTYGVDLSISLGGADAGNLRSNRLNAVCGNSTYRATLVSELVQFAIDHNLYGIDVDWEFPTTAGARDNHEALLQDLDAAIAASSNPNIKIGVAVGGEYTNSINHLQYFNNNAVQYVDDFHIMAYDFPSSYDVNHSALDDGQNSFNEWNSVKGVPKAKMYLGVPFYGRNSARTTESDYRNFSVGLASYDVDVYGGNYYNGKTTLETKAQWVVDQGGQGIMIWDLGQDRTDAYSLLNVLYDKMSSICPAPQPSLGPDVGFCTGTITLNSGVSTFAGRTFTWKKNGVVVGTANSTTATTLDVTVGGGGTYLIEVTQGGCTKTDQIEVTEGSSLSLTGATRCGPGEVTLTVNTTGGTYDWYDALTGGTLVHTGQTYTPTLSADATYYVQEDNGSTTYTGIGRTVPRTESPWAWNEAATSYGGTLPKWAHKITVSQDLTIQTVKVWTSGVALTGVQLMVISTTNGTSILQQSTAVNLPASSGPHTLTANFTLTSGSYYIGVFAPGTIGGGATDPGIWMDHDISQASTQAGVYDIAGTSWVSYAAGFNADPTPTAHYGQLFDWVISTGVVPPCGRTSVTATINAAANTGLSVTSVSPICSGVDGTVTVVSSESNVSYQPYIGASTAGAATSGTGSDLALVVNSSSLTTGSNTITVKATKTGCGTVNLTTEPVIVVNAGTAPTITYGDITKTYGDAAFSHLATSNSSGALTYSLDGSTPASIVTVSTAGLVTITGAGTATIKVDQAASGCYAAGSKTITLTIDKAALTVTADDKSRVYGATNPTFTVTITGYVNSETSTVLDVSPTASSTASGTSGVGTHTITASGGSDNNYTFTYVSGTLTIGKATLTVTADDKTRAYGAANPTFTVTLTGFANGETSSVINVMPTASSTAISTTGVGTVAITPAGGSDDNYTFSYINGTLTIEKANRIVSITSTSNGSVGGTINLTYSVSGGGTAVWSKTDGTGSATLNVAALSLVSAGTVTVQIDIAADANYNATSNTQVITISSSPTPTITFTDATKTFGDAPFFHTATSNSSGAMTYAFVSSTPSGIISVASNGEVTILGAGTATISVDQVADGSFAAGSATATITINKANRTVTITSANSGNEGTDIGLTFTTSAGAGNDSWSVTNGTGTATISGSTLSLVSAGTVTVEVDIDEDANYNATSNMLLITINTATGLFGSTSSNGLSMKVYPNPFEITSVIEFELQTAGEVDLEVYDVLGYSTITLMKGEHLSAGMHIASLSGLNPGVYMIKLRMDGKEKSIKVVKN